MFIFVEVQKFATYHLYISKCLFVAFSFWIVFLSAQEIQSEKLRDLRLKVSDLGSANSEALPVIKKYLAEAKRQKNYSYVADAYDDLSANLKDPAIKLKYADSAIHAAKMSRNSFTLGTKYLAKGSILYFQFRSYQDALNNFLNAKKYLSNPEDTTDQYYQFKNLYFIGATKAYLGQYNEALVVFRQCLNFYKPAAYSIDHPNNLYNFRKGYLNCLIQYAFCYQNLGNYAEAKNLIREALENLPPKEFENELSYLQQLQGMAFYKKSLYGAALKNFSESSRKLASEGDFGRLQINNLYTAKSYAEMRDTPEAVQYFQKNDSIFVKHNFLFPQAREGYEFLIKYFAKQGDKDRQLYYTNQLLKADRILERDFKVLSARIHKEYDTAELTAQRDRLQSRTSSLGRWLFGFGALAILFFGLFLHRRSNEQKLKHQYTALEQRFHTFSEKTTFPETTEPSSEPQTGNPNLQSEPIREAKPNLQNKDWQLLAHLQAFEAGNSFTRKGLTVAQLAQEFGVSASDLSRVINEHKGTNFSRYLRGLRIAYITKLLFTERKYLEYKIEALASECGIASRQNFSDLFTEVNGMRPKDFIALRRKELE